jgi:hypothetical protein
MSDSWTEARDYFKSIGVITQKDMEEWIKKHPIREDQIIDCPCCRDKNK